MSEETTETATGAAFSRYFGPLLEALRKLGGSGTVKEVVSQIAQDLSIPSQVQEELLPSGAPKFQNQVQWARLYLAKEGLLASSKRGVWALTEAGQHATLTQEEAQQIVKRQVNEYRKQRSQEQTQEASGPNDLTEGLPATGSTDTTPPTSIDEIDPDSIATSPLGTYREEVLSILRNAPPDSFERFCQQLLREAGFTEVKVTGKSGDGGIDGYGTLEINPLVSFKVLFQCKRYKDVVGPHFVRDFRGAMQGRADKGIILTTGTFTQGAIEEACRDGVPPIELIDAQRLIDLMEKFEFGLEPVQTFQVNHQFFKDF